MAWGSDSAVARNLGTAAGKNRLGGAQDQADKAAAAAAAARLAPAPIDTTKSISENIERARLAAERQRRKATGAGTLLTTMPAATATTIAAPPAPRTLLGY